MVILRQLLCKTTFRSTPQICLYTLFKSMLIDGKNVCNPNNIVCVGLQFFFCNGLVCTQLTVLDKFFLKREPFSSTFILWDRNLIRVLVLQFIKYLIPFFVPKKGVHSSISSSKTKKKNILKINTLLATLRILNKYLKHIYIVLYKLKYTK